MKIGIVGHAAEKFTTATEAKARIAIAKIIFSRGGWSFDPPNYDITIVSGHSPMGGVDIWAEEIGTDLGCTLDIKAPTRHTWGGEGGFQDRNLQIAETSDEVHVVVVQTLPDNYKGMVFPLCYHCAKRAPVNPSHIKSGACWTAYQAVDRGKLAFWHIIEP